MNDKLEPLEPGEALSLYIESREDELAERTLELQEKQLLKFVKWLRGECVHDMNDLTARTVHQYKLHIRKRLANSTVAIHLSTIHQFIRFCEHIDGVGSGVAEKIDIPTRDENARDEKLDTDDADHILSYLREFHYASRSNALLTLMWHTGIRTGTVRALDVSDFDGEQERLRIRHRPETGTPLKNKKKAERYIALSPEVAETVSDYIEYNRHGVTDPADRHPLFTTRNGRPALNSIRRNVYAVTRPCATGGECPHGRDQDECGAAGGSKGASKCPSSLSGHPVRRGAITHFLREDVPEKVVSDRMNVSQDILDRHYDRRTEAEKTEQRRSFLSNI